MEAMPISKGQQNPFIDNRSVLKDYFLTLRLPMITGRDFTADEISSSAHVAVVNKSFARRYWSVETAVNKRFRGADPSGGETPWMTIVGVCNDTHDLQGSEREVLPCFYAPFAPFPSNSDMTFIIRSGGNPSLLASTVRQEFARLNS